ncbi:MAG: DUF3080 family protein [Pontibacterium sp.]
MTTKTSLLPHRQSLFSRLRRRLTFIAATSVTPFLLSACGPANPGLDLLEDYLYRLSNTLDTPIDNDLSPAPLPLYPTAKVNRFTFDPLTQGVIEVFELGYCEGILDLIAQRNSSLGKVMRPSAQYRYELSFFDKIQRCHQKAEQDPEIEPELKNTIASIADQKRQQLPAVAWNSLFSSEEIDQQFDRTAQLIAPPEEKGQAAGIPELANGFTRLSALALSATQTPFEYPSDSATNESYYEALYRQPIMGELHNSLNALTLTMERATAALKHRTETKPLCRPGLYSKQAPILANVFDRYYLGGFQPYLAHIHRLAQSTLVPLADAYAALPKPEGFITFGDQQISTTHPDSVWLRYINARDQHTKAWQRILRDCNIRQV